MLRPIVSRTPFRRSLLVAKLLKALETDVMDISRHLERDSETLAGAVRVRGSRLSVDFILELFENGWAENEVRENYPQLTSEVLADVFAFARQALHSEQIISLTP
jgi:uncharacterized protein (DUF433 family)